MYINRTYFDFAIISAFALSKETWYVSNGSLSLIFLFKTDCPSSQKSLLDASPISSLKSPRIIKQQQLGNKLQLAPFMR